MLQEDRFDEGCPQGVALGAGVQSIGDEKIIGQTPALIEHG
jgi:hypothetical protein